MTKPFNVTGTMYESSGPDEIKGKGIHDGILAFTVLVEKCHLPEGKLPADGSPVHITMHDLTALQESDKEQTHEPAQDGRCGA